MNLNPLSIAGDIFGKILDRFSADKNKILETQSEINRQEIEGAPVSRLRLWRSFVGWVAGLVFAWELVARPVITTYWPDVTLPPSMLKEVLQVLFALFGFSF